MTARVHAHCLGSRKYLLFNGLHCRNRAVQNRQPSKNELFVATNGSFLATIAVFLARNTAFVITNAAFLVANDPAFIPVLSLSSGILPVRHTIAFRVGFACRCFTERTQVSDCAARSAGSANSWCRGVIHRHAGKSTTHIDAVV